MIEYFFVFFMGLTLGGIVQLIWSRRKLKSFWSELTDYYYMEHIYPLMKTNRLQAIQRELAWQAFIKKEGFSLGTPVEENHDTIRA